MFATGAKGREFDARSLEPSTYLTDGERLFRVTRGFTDRVADGFAVLEDCRTLEAITLTPDQLYEMHLELVRRAQG